MTLLPPDEGVAAPDREDIVRVVQLYIDGFNDCDVDKFKRAFHEDALIFFTHRDSTLYKGLIADSSRNGPRRRPSGSWEGLSR